MISSWYDRKSGRPTSDTLLSSPLWLTYFRRPSIMLISQLPALCLHPNAYQTVWYQTVWFNPLKLFKGVFDCDLIFVSKRSFQIKSRFIGSIHFVFIFYWLTNDRTRLNLKTNLSFTRVVFGWISFLANRPGPYSLILTSTSFDTSAGYV